MQIRWPLFLLALPGILCAQRGEPIRLKVDVTDAPRKILHAHLQIPVKAGPLTLAYPEWIPGEHGPTGPIDNMAGLAFSANGQAIPWHRDDVNMFTFHLTVPAGAAMLDASIDFLATAPPSGFSAGACTNPNLAIISWNQFALYPAGAPAADVMYTPAVTLPEGWKFGTALTQRLKDRDTVTFETVPLDMLVDSPLLAGRFFKEIPLAPDVVPRHFLDMAADGPEDLDISNDDVESYSRLVRETGALYQSRHFASYHFLVTLSDTVAHFGLEHHQSSDDRVDARTFIDEDLNTLDASLLPHEFTHSWNGKYRRPAGLATTNYGQPMKGDLLWVYEGLTEYLSDILSARCGLWTADQFRAMLATSAAELDARPGRNWRDLEDTAIAAQTLYATSDQWDNWRRSVDYYSEGALIWLDADVTIRKLSGGKRSLNDFCARFLGAGGNTPPKVVTYTFESLVADMNAIEPYNWSAFFNERLASKGPHAPLAGISNSGYKLEFTDRENEFTRYSEGRDRGVNAWYSLGFKTSDLALEDVLVDGLAYKAGLGPGMKLVAVNGRRATDELLHAAIRGSKTNRDPIQLIVDNAGFFKVVEIDYHEGEKYPHLQRDEKSPDILNEILKPMAPKAKSVLAQ
jgi:predicted metalloprotease with PDZ domain